MKRTVGIPHRPFFLYPFLRKREVKTMKYRIITLIGLAGSTLAVCFGGWDKFLQTLLLFMAIDWFTGGILLPAVFGKSPKSEMCTGKQSWMERFVQKRHDIVVCSHCCPSGCIDGDRISERCGMHWIYCK